MCKAQIKTTNLKIRFSRRSLKVLSPILREDLFGFITQCIRDNMVQRGFWGLHHHFKKAFIKILPCCGFRQKRCDLIDDQHVLLLKIPDRHPRLPG